MSPRPTRRRARRGMTLIEVLVSIAIVVVMGGIGWASLEGAIELNQVLAEGDSTTRGARVALGRLRRELQLAYLTDNRANPDRYQTVFVGFDENPDRLYFATLAHQRLYRNSRESDQGEVTVWAEDGPREKGDGDILFHREAGRIDQYPDEGGRIYPLAYNVKEFNLRYLDGRDSEWADEWDTRGTDAPNILPRAVQIALVLLAPDPEDEDDTIEVPFLTTVLLQHAEPVQPLLGEGQTTGVTP